MVAAACNLAADAAGAADAFASDAAVAFASADMDDAASVAAVADAAVADAADAAVAVGEGGAVGGAVGCDRTAPPVTVQGPGTAPVPVPASGSRTAQGHWPQGAESRRRRQPRPARRQAPRRRASLAQSWSRRPPQWLCTWPKKEQRGLEPGHLQTQIQKK